MTDADRPTVLLETLRLAVPMHREELRGLPVEQILAIATRSAVAVGTHGDDLQFGGKRCASTFNALARGLAAAALTADGGVTWLGAHWCATPSCHSVDAHLDEPVPAPPEPRRPHHPPAHRDRPVHTIHVHGGLL